MSLFPSSSTYLSCASDFRRIIEIKTDAPDARAQLDQTLALLTGNTREEEEEREDIFWFTDLNDIMTTSDSSEYRHEGNGRSCRYNNHDGCRHGAECRFRHAPDDMSVRDEL